MSFNRAVVALFALCLSLLSATAHADHTPICPIFTQEGSTLGIYRDAQFYAQGYDQPHNDQIVYALNMQCGINHLVLVPVPGKYSYAASGAFEEWHVYEYLEVIATVNIEADAQEIVRAMNRTYGGVE